MIYFITYDLHGEPRKYNDVNRVIQQEGVGYSVHSMGSNWFIDTQANTSAWINALRSASDSNDEFFVSRIHDEDWTGWLLDGPTKDWLANPARRW